MVLLTVIGLCCVIIDVDTIIASQKNIYKCVIADRSKDFGVGTHTLISICNSRQVR